MPAKLLFVLGGLGAGGTERGLLWRLQEWDAQGFDLRIACMTRQGQLADEFHRLGIPILGLDKAAVRWGRAGRLLGLLHIMRRERPTIVENMVGTPSFYGAIAARLAGIPIVVSHQRNMGYWVDSRGRRALLRAQMRYLSTHVLVNAVAIKQWLAANEYCPPDKISVVYSGLRLRDERSAAASMAEVKARLGLSPETFVVGCVAGLRPVKGVDVLVRAVPRLIRYRPDTKVVIIGDGPERPRLARLAQELGVEHAVMMTGGSPEPAEWIPAFDVGVQPSRSEGLPTSVLEYMRDGKPVVATAVGGVPEIVEDGGSGFIVPAEDVTALAECLERLEKDPVLRRRMGARGAGIVRSRFDLRAVVQEYDRLYRSWVGSLAQAGA